MMNREAAQSTLNRIESAIQAGDSVPAEHLALLQAHTLLALAEANERLAAAQEDANRLQRIANRAAAEKAPTARRGSRTVHLGGGEREF